ncbi:putative pyruvyl transferase EpsO [Rhodovastum atsumiense]|nr:polysaccharide pyruvyl transferase family protein [Rhodovastum atsumiense]CAH2604266.1 putative pyruvyl transferase EpsO [Rhodovastum atsumiense]
MAVTSADLIARLADAVHTALGPLIQPDQNFALIDFPDHSNVGDSAIWTGEIAYFRERHGIAPSLIAAHRPPDPDLVARAIGDGPVFIHGGGNLGDTWPSHQLAREEALHLYRGRRVIQLPQSLHFDDPAALARMADAVAAHGDFVLLVRDRESLETARAHFRCETRLCPDMAFCLGPQARRGVPVHDLLVLARLDHESASAAPEDLPPGAVRMDWLAESDAFLARAKLKSLATSVLDCDLRALDREAQRDRYRRRLAEARVERGLALLSSARAVATDRLHAHILCLLLGIPHAVADNSYGKLGRFISAWTQDSTLLRMAPSLPAAIEMAGELALS